MTIRGMWRAKCLVIPRAPGASWQQGVVVRNPALADPTCEEGGDAKLREGGGANAGNTTLCETDPTDFCITEKKEGAESGEVRCGDSRQVDRGKTIMSMTYTNAITQM